MASDHVIDEIKARIDIVDLIGRYVSLKQSGRTHKALCPFHQENTPSFVVFPHTDTWHCFGACGEGGDVFTFIQKIEGLEFSEALEMLAREAGVELRPLDRAAMEARERRERLRAVCDAAAELFREWLRTHSDAAACRAYVQERQIEPETAHRFTLGYALDRWDGLLQALTERGYRVEDIEAAGLVIPRDSGGYYDRFRNRLVFPIRDIRGRVVGFGGRILPPNGGSMSDADQPKYINSPQTEIFDKSRLLYGLDLAKDAIREEDRVVVVEGYMDVIAAHQAGFRNVVASLGTALTADQLKLIKRFSKHITLALDADTAGTEATRRGVEAAREALDRRLIPRVGQRGRLRYSVELDGELRILRMPEGYDPDDLLQEDPTRWQVLIEEALPVVDYFFEVATAGRDLEEVQEKKAVAGELLPIIADIGNVVERAHYLQQLAQALHVSERDLNTQLLKMLRRRPKRRRRPETTPEEPPNEIGGMPADDVQSAESYVLYLMTQRLDLLSTALEAGLSPEAFQSTENRALVEALFSEAPDSPPAVDAFVEDLSPALARRFQAITAYYGSRPNYAEQLTTPLAELEPEFLDKVKKLKIAAAKRRREHLKSVIDDMLREPEYDRIEWVRLTQQFNEITRWITRQERELHQQKNTNQTILKQEEPPLFLSPGGDAYAEAPPREHFD